MIYCREANFILIKSRKTAGTSLEIALSTACSENDIITPISSEDELIRYEMGGMLPRNYVAERIGENAYRRAIETKDCVAIDLARPKTGKMQFWNHMPSSIVLQEIGSEEWGRCFKVAFDRHPYEKAVSAAYFRGKGKEEMFQAKLEDVIDNAVCRNWELYTIDGEISVDRVYRYEDMNAALEDIRSRIGVQLASRLPRAKTDFRKDRRPAYEILSASQRDRVYEMCREEFEYHGYER